MRRYIKEDTLKKDWRISAVVQVSICLSLVLALLLSGETLLETKPAHSHVMCMFACIPA